MQFQSSLTILRKIKNILENQQTWRPIEHQGNTRNDTGDESKGDKKPGESSA
jgi:hypothetical protein